MDAMIVEVYVPATDRTFDFRLPSSCSVREVVLEMVRVLEFTEQNVVFDRENPLLCHVGHAAVLHPDKTLVECDVRDGAKLLLL